MLELGSRHTIVVVLVCFTLEALFLVRLGEAAASSTTVNGTRTTTLRTTTIRAKPTKATKATTEKPTTSSQGPCLCHNGQCGCCVPFGFRHRVCLNINYDPDEFAFTTSLNMDGATLFSNQISGKNPAPLCLKIRSSQLCLALSNLYFAGENLHTCIGVKAELIGTAALDTVLGCVRVGTNGVAILSPEDGGGLALQKPPEAEIEDYDDNA